MKLQNHILNIYNKKKVILKKLDIINKKIITRYEDILIPSAVKHARHEMMNVFNISYNAHF